MSDFQPQDATAADARAEALEHIVERVRAWQETAPEGTIETELQAAADEAGVELSDEQLQRVADAISEGRDVDPGEVFAAPQ